ncbi:hypothetical protein NDI89_12105 [Natrinema sp. S1CR25-10]|uniref:Uncharacterized protein n=1 Tax=Natrinema salsiterrestre TaxID=2950540 RepID=A0A9Q4Q0B7_9EURY|nr:hypothetical protein [Natrinema salsiterrestre]
MYGKNSASLAAYYAILVAFGAMLLVPDPTGALNVLVAIAGLGIVGVALIDGSVRELRPGIGALYAFGIVASVGVWALQDPLWASEVYGTVVEVIAVLSLAVLLGTYLIARHRGTGGDRSLADRTG